MPSDLFLRIIDILFALLLAWLLVISLRTGRIGGNKGFRFHRTERPVLYWLCIFVLAVAVLRAAWPD